MLHREQLHPTNEQCVCGEAVQVYVREEARVGGSDASEDSSGETCSEITMLGQLGYDVRQALRGLLCDRGPYNLKRVLFRRATKVYVIGGAQRIQASSRQYKDKTRTTNH